MPKRLKATLAMGALLAAALSGSAAHAAVADRAPAQAEAPAPMGTIASADLRALSRAGVPHATGEAVLVARRTRGPRRGWRHRAYRGGPYVRIPRRHRPRRFYRGPRFVYAPPVAVPYRAPCTARVVRVRPNGAVVRVVRPCLGAYRYW
ncbi:MAG: hypothetical protein AAGF49_09285 [Pseudomonadota bacterium]